MKQFGLTARVLASVLVFGVLTPMPPATAALSPVISPASLQSAAFAKVAPKNTKAPTISGTTRVPNQLSVTNGTWSGVPTSYTHQWLRCNAAVKKAAATLAAGCSTIDTATASTYTLTDADAGKFMVARVSGVNASGTVSIHSASTVAVTPRVIAPKNTVAATISGTAQVSRVLTATNGTWIESPVEFGYQWYRCSKAVKKASSSLTKGCNLIANQTESTYQLTSNDARRFVLAQIIASNSAGSSSIFTKTLSSVGLPSNYAPALYIAPDIHFEGEILGEPTSAISGAANLGGVLVSSKGQWTGYPTPEVTVSSWYRCETERSTAPISRPMDCDAIAESDGANGDSYTLTGDDVGHFLALEVTATNSVGTSQYFTGTTAEVSARPTLIESPSITGEALLGETLEVNDGRWSVEPGVTLDYDYDWYRCDSIAAIVVDGTPTNCALIESGSESLTLGQSNLGKHLVATVSATNNFGETIAATTSPTTAIQSAPGIADYPEVEGTRQTGSDLAVVDGSWIAFPMPTTTFQWYRCDTAVPIGVSSLPIACHQISGATSATYSQTSSDAGKYVTVATTKVNSIGSTSVWSVGSAVTNQLPLNEDAPVVLGGNLPGATLFASDGRWNAFPTPDVTREWIRCTSPIIEPTDIVPDTCTEVPGQSGSVLNLIADHVGSYLSVVVTASNHVGHSSFVSSSSGLIGALPALDPSAFEVSGPNTTGSSVVASGLSSSGTPNPSIAYSWFRCENLHLTAESVPSDCETIPGEHDETYSIGWSDSGFYLGVLAVAENVHGEDSAFRTVDTPAIPSGDIISSGYRHTCVRTEGANLYCWGLNNFGQSGDTSSTTVSAPRLVPLAAPVKEVSAGYLFSCAIVDQVGANVYCWGDNRNGIFGNGTLTSARTPTLTPQVRAVDLSSGYGTVCVVTETASGSCWGGGAYGNLGNGSLESPISNPVTFVDSSGTSKISTSDAHTCHVKAGEVWCVGYEPLGALGDWNVHADFRSLVPVKVQGVTNAFGVIAGYRHTCSWGASMYCWGDNNSFQSGYMSPQQSQTPVRIDFPEPTQVIKIDTMDQTTCLLTAERFVHCTGRGDFGQLGGGGTGNSNYFARIPDLAHVIDITVGQYFACAVIRGGSVTCWGQNSNSQIDSSGRDRLVPTEITGLPPAG
jgi:hypothetical protein